MPTYSKIPGIGYNRFPWFVVLTISGGNIIHVNVLENGDCIAICDALFVDGANYDYNTFRSRDGGVNWELIDSLPFPAATIFDYGCQPVGSKEKPNRAVVGTQGAASLQPILAPSAEEQGYIVVVNDFKTEQGWSSYQQQDAGAPQAPTRSGVYGGVEFGEYTYRMFHIIRNAETGDVIAISDAEAKSEKPVKVEPHFPEAHSSWIIIHDYPPKVDSPGDNPNPNWRVFFRSRKDHISGPWFGPIFPPGETITADTGYMAPFHDDIPDKLLTITLPNYKNSLWPEIDFVWHWIDPYSVALYSDNAGEDWLSDLNGDVTITEKGPGNNNTVLPHEWYAEHLILLPSGIFVMAGWYGWFDAFFGSDFDYYGDVMISRDGIAFGGRINIAPWWDEDNNPPQFNWYQGALSVALYNGDTIFVGLQIDGNIFVDSDGTNRDYLWGSTQGGLFNDSDEYRALAQLPRIWQTSGSSQPNPPHDFAQNNGFIGNFSTPFSHYDNQTAFLVIDKKYITDKSITGGFNTDIFVMGTARSIVQKVTAYQELPDERKSTLPINGYGIHAPRIYWGYRNSGGNYHIVDQTEFVAEGPSEEESYKYGVNVIGQKVMFQMPTYFIYHPDHDVAIMGMHHRFWFFDGSLFQSSVPYRHDPFRYSLDKGKTWLHTSGLLPTNLDRNIEYLEFTVNSMAMTKEGNILAAVTFTTPLEGRKNEIWLFASGGGLLGDDLRSLGTMMS